MAYEDIAGDIDPREDPAFLSVSDVVVLHEDGIKRYSPTESRILCDHRLLESAVMAPQQTFGGAYLYGTLTEMATAYLIGLAFNHRFENGNKRAAFAACSTFLRMNGYRLTLTQDEAVSLTLRVVKHELEREAVVEILDGAVELL